MARACTESVVEDAAFAWLEALCYTVLHGPNLAAGEPLAECSDPNYRDVLLDRRLRRARQQRLARRQTRSPSRRARIGLRSFSGNLGSDADDQTKYILIIGLRI
jgi:hypothetical protein